MNYFIPFLLQFPVYYVLVNVLDLMYYFGENIRGGR